MFVALGTLEADAEERGGGLLAPLLVRHSPLLAPEQVERLAVGVLRLLALLLGLFDLRDLFDVLVEGHLVPAGRREDALDDLVIRHVVRDALAQPVVPHLTHVGPALWRVLQRVGVVAGDVAELRRPEGGV